MTEKIVQHTELPWQCVGGTTIIGSDGEPIAKVSWPTPNLEEQKANIAFIVRACNSHEGLLEACREALDLMLHLEWIEPNALTVKANMRAAIAKAERIEL